MDLDAGNLYRVTGTEFSFSADKLWVFNKKPSLPALGFSCTIYLQGVRVKFSPKIRISDMIFFMTLL